MTKLVFISDTHGYRVDIPSCDILVHSGDATGVGRVDQLDSFNAWARKLKKDGVVKDVVFIAGNHDLSLDASHKSVTQSRKKLHEQALRVLSDVVYLQDSGIDLHGVSFYGSPWTPRFYDWAFQIDNEGHGRSLFAKIPSTVDVLVTHGPPFGVLDTCDDGRIVGSLALLEAVGRVKPKIHAFGHIHHSYGQATDADLGTRFINASTCTEQYKPTNPPIEIDMGAL